MLVRPHDCIVEIVEETVAVRPQYRHVTCGLDQTRLKAVTLFATLSETGGEADRAARAHPGKAFHHLDALVAAYRDEACVRRHGQIVDRAQAGYAADLIPCGMHRPDIAGEAGLLQLRDYVCCPAAAEQGDGFRGEQAGQVARHPNASMLTRYSTSAFSPFGVIA